MVNDASRMILSGLVVFLLMKEFNHIKMNFNTFLGLLEEKLRLVEEIHTYSRAQAGLTFVDHAEEYQSFMEKRQKCINELTILENKIQEEQRVIAALNLDQGSGEKISIVNDKIQQLVQQILALDKQNIIEISAEMQDVKVKLESIGRGRRGNTGYANAGKVDITGGFMDSRR